MKKTVLILLAIQFAVGLKAQTRDTIYRFTVKEAIAYAMDHQKTVQNARLDVEISDAKVNEILGIGLPQINSNFNLQDFEALPTSLIPGEFFGEEAGTFIPVKFGTRWNATASLTASQLLFDPTYLIGVKATRTLHELTNKNLNRTEIETAVAVSKAYYNLILLIERKKSVDANLVRVQKLYDDTKAMYDNGFVEKLAVDRFKVSLNNVTTEVDNFNRFLVLSNNILKFQIGMEQSSVLEPAETIDAEAIKNINIPLDKYDISLRIEYSIMESQKKLQEYNIKRYRSGYYPTLVAYGSLSTNAQRQEFNFTDPNESWYTTGLIGATLSLPIFDGLQKKNKIKQEKLSLRKIENEMTHFEQSVSIEVKSYRDALVNAISALNIQEQNLKLANEIYTTSKLKYDQGVGSNLEIMDAETSLKDSQANYFNALHDAMIAKINLEKSLGKFY